MRIPTYLAVGVWLMAALIGVRARGDAWSDFLAKAEADKDGEAGRAAKFLAANAPEADRAGLTEVFLSDNLNLALETRARFQWAKAVPEEIFFNDVLPYAALDERREVWRSVLLALAAPLVKGCRTASEAAQVLNRDLFKKLNVHYGTDRPKANQSPAESMATGTATCTGLSILLVDACRAVGVPARVAGLEQWTNKPGNHTWVEIWDGGWHFTGAAEYAREGLDHAWFADDIAHGHAVQPVYAVSWKPTGLHFPLAWNLEENSVPAVLVTDHYQQPKGDGREILRHVQLFDKPDGERLAASVEWVNTAGQILSTSTTKSSSADMNDMGELAASDPGKGSFLRARVGDEWREWPVDLAQGNDATVKLSWAGGGHSNLAIALVKAWLAEPAAKRGAAPDLSLSATEAKQILELLWADRRAVVAESEKEEMAHRMIVRGDKKMPWLERTFGAAPATGRSLWISLHGGGNAPPEVNEEQWQNQIRLYEPAEGIVVAPRAPTNTWNLWHESHIDPMFDELIAGMVATRGVDPNRVYLLGYSAGGDGVYQLAPRMADRWAAASMMAGHPNSGRPESLRDLPFYIFVGGEDDGYNRNTVAAKYGAKLDALEAADPGGYVHKTTIYPGLGHWMDRRDREALQWMAADVRDPWPKKVVWRQGETTHDRFYWLKLAPGVAKKDQTITASVQGQVITVESPDLRGVTLRLSDALVNLDEPVSVVVAGKTIYSGLVRRTAGNLFGSLAERADPTGAAAGELTVAW